MTNQVSNGVTSPGRKCTVQWGSENQTCTDFKWCPVFE